MKNIYLTACHVCQFSEFQLPQSNVFTPLMFSHLAIGMEICIFPRGVKTLGGVKVAPGIKSRDTAAMPFYTYILVCPKTNHISHSALH